MQTVQTRQPHGFWLVTGAAILWGTIGVALKGIYSSDSTTSLFINFARLFIATPIMLIACWRVLGSAMFRIRQRALLIMLMSGIFLALSQAAYFAAIRYSGVTIPTLLTMCISPVVVTFVSVLLKFETLTRRTVIALVCALVGSFLLVGLQSADGTQDGVFLGVICSTIAAVTYAIMIICGRFVAADYHPLQVTTITFAAGTLILIPINLLSGVVVAHTGQGWLLILYLGLVPTAFAYWLFQKGLRSVSATTASIVGMLDPVVAALLAWLLFGETLEARGLIGAGLLILSIFLLSLNKPE